MQQSGRNKALNGNSIDNSKRTGRRLLETSTQSRLLILGLVALSVASNLVGYNKVIVLVDNTGSGKTGAAQDHSHYSKVEEKEKQQQRHTQQQTSLEERLLQNYSGLLSPIWPSCLMIDTAANDSRSNNNATATTTGRLFFVHVFKTAGSSLRSFFLHHVGPTCRKSVIEVSGCAHLSHASAAAPQHGDNKKDAIWKAASDSKGRCFAPHTQSPRRAASNNSDDNNASTINVWKQRPLTRRWLEQHGDIVVGHQPLGLHAYLDDHNPTPPAYQYVTFFREPVAKYVSGRLYLKRGAWSSVDEAAAAIRARVLRAMKSNKKSGDESNHHYNAYERYLTTPAQKDEIIARRNLSGGDVADLIATNLVQLDVLVGLVERMDTSLALLQSVVDPEQQLTASLQLLLNTGTVDDDNNDSNNNSNSNSLVVNRSRLSTSAIVERLLRNSTTFAETLRGYLRHELRLYAFARALHERQVQQLRRRHGDRYFRPFLQYNT